MVFLPIITVERLSTKGVILEYSNGSIMFSSVSIIQKYPDLSAMYLFSCQ